MRSDGHRGPKRGIRRSQSAVEYITTYGWAIVIITIVIGVALYYAAEPKSVVPNTCAITSTSGGLSCTDIAVSTNTIVGNTYAFLYIINSNPTEVGNVAAFVQLGSVNTSEYACGPSNVLSGGATYCRITLPSELQNNQYVAGRVYVSYMNCGLSANYVASGGLTSSFNSEIACTGAPTNFVTGTFTAHVQLSAPLTTSSTSTSTTTSTSNPTSTRTGGGGSVYGNVSIELINGAVIDASGITAGAVIASFNLQTGELEPSVITSVYRRTVFNKYVFNGDLQVDADEIMFVNGHWERAYMAKVGDTLFDPLTGLYVPISTINITNYTAPQTVYDFVASPMNNYIADGFLIDVKTDLTVLGTTEVSLANGGVEPLSELTPGTAILGYDLSTKEVVPTVVVNVTARNESGEYIINNGSIVAAPDELVILNGTQQPISAARLGDTLLSPLNNTQVKVSSIVILNGTFQLYDMVSTPIDNYIGNGYSLT